MVGFYSRGGDGAAFEQGEPAVGGLQRVRLCCGDCRGAEGLRHHESVSGVKIIVW